MKEDDNPKPNEDKDIIKIAHDVALVLSYLTDGIVQATEDLRPELKPKRKEEAENAQSIKGKIPAKRTGSPTETVEDTKVEIR